MPKCIVLISLVSWLSLSSFCIDDIWGFYAHRLINKTAIFILPPELSAVFKLNLDEIERYAIAPDQRRHASPHEAIRHYIDIDTHGDTPFEVMPRSYNEAVWKYADIYFLSENMKDTLLVKEIHEIGESKLKDSILTFFRMELRYSEDDETTFDLNNVHLPLEDLDQYDKNFRYLYFKDNLSEHGILPFHLMEYQNKLMRAFANGDVDNLIRYAGEMGHYISDAHVPLHTTENYNGQLTGQDGIHAFWETRLPELFASEEYEFWVGKAQYIDDKEDYFWNIVEESHDLVDDVLRIEKDLRQTFPKDNQYCFAERLGSTRRLECEAYARAFQDAMNGMVESRLSDAILAIGSSWYTAWVDAGSPKMQSDKVVFFEDLNSDTLDSIRISNSRIHD